MKCRHCKKELKLDEILSLLKAPITGQLWFGFDCPHCKLENMIEFTEAEIRLGFLDGVPGPNFVVCESLKDKRYHFNQIDETNRQGIEIKIGAWHFFSGTVDLEVKVKLVAFSNKEIIFDLNYLSENVCRIGYRRDDGVMRVIPEFSKMDQISDFYPAVTNVQKLRDFLTALTSLKDTTFTINLPVYQQRIQAKNP